MTSYKVLYSGGTLPSAALKKFVENRFDVEIVSPTLDDDELAEALRGKDAYILAGLEHVTRSTLRYADRLRVLAFLGVGYGGFVDIDDASERGIAVTNAPGANARAVAEFSVALLLDAWRRISFLNGETKKGTWTQRVGSNIEGKTLGVLGMGSIGAIVARIAFRGFGMRIVYSGRTVKPEVELELQAERLQIADLLAQVDALSIHIPYSSATHHLLNHNSFDQMKRGAVVVNTSEAEIVDPAALRAALEDGRISIAAMDGYYIEPTPSPAEDPYGLLAFSSDRLLITPHTANSTTESFEAMLAANLDSLRNVLSTGNDTRVVNPDFKYHAMRKTQ